MAKFVVYRDCKTVNYLNLLLITNHAHQCVICAGRTTAFPRMVSVIRGLQSTLSVIIVCDRNLYVHCIMSVYYIVQPYAYMLRQKNVSPYLNKPYFGCWPLLGPPRPSAAPLNASRVDRNKHLRISVSSNLKF